MKLFEMIKDKMKKKSEEKSELEEIKKQARKEALLEAKPELIKFYKEQEIEKMKKSSISWSEKLGKEFKNAADDIFSKEKINRVISSNTSQSADTGMFSQDKLSKMLEGTPGQSKSRSRSKQDEEDRMKKFLE